MSSHHNNRRSAMITGAAGQIGQKIAEHLVGQGKSVIGLYHQKLPTAHKNLLPLCCDLNSTESIIAPLKSTYTVVHLAWQGGVLGAQGAASTRLEDAEIQSSPNVTMTRNLIQAMERAGAKRILFLSWVGVNRRSSSQMLREKYWAENLIINSQIPEKIIIRAGVIGSGLSENAFLRSASTISKWPIILPLPRNMDGVVLTTLSDILWAVDEALKITNTGETNCRIIDLTSTKPSSGASVLEAIEAKIWGKRRIAIGGLIGNALFRWSQLKFGRVQNTEPRMTDFFEASKISNNVPASGLPPTSFGIDLGHKMELIKAL